MTPVRFQLDPAAARIGIRPWRRFVEGTTVHWPDEDVYTAPAGATSFQVELAPGPYQFRELGSITRLCVVPDTTTTVEYATLPDVDPDTLDPVAEPVAAWWAQVSSLETRVQAVEAATGGPRALSYTHTQPTPSSVWDVEHNLGYRPAGVRVVGSDGDTYWPDVQYLTTNSVRLTLPTTLLGVAYLS